MRIGMDISIAECRRSGYMVMDFKKRDLIKNGILNKDCPVTLSVSFPHAWNDAGKPMFGETNLWCLEPSEFTWNNLMDYISIPKERESVASCCDWKNCSPNFDNPNEYDLLHLASDINAYGGLS